MKIPNTAAFILALHQVIPYTVVVVVIIYVFAYMNELFVKKKYKQCNVDTYYFDQYFHFPNKTFLDLALDHAMVAG